MTGLNGLGWLLRRGGPPWHKYVLCARELREATKHEFAEYFARALGLTSHPIPFGTHCPTCPPPASDNNHPSAHTALCLPDRYVARSTKCGSEWVHLTEQHHLEPFRAR